MKWTKIAIKEKTRKRIEVFARMNDSHSDFIDEMLDHISRCSCWWEDRYHD